MATARPGPRFAALAAALVAAAGLASADRGAAATRGELQFAYAMDCTFAVLDEAGRAVTKIEPGTYGVVISTPVPFATVRAPGPDGFTACNGAVDFGLTGPGVSIRTTLGAGGKSEERHVATFEAGRTYTAAEGKRPATSLVVVLPAAAPVVASPETRADLTATVRTAGRASLAFHGKRVAKVRPGRHVVLVTDRSRSAGSVLRKAGGGRTIVLSTPAFVGKRTATVRLTAGVWLFTSGTGSPIRFVVAAA